MGGLPGLAAFDKKQAGKPFRLLGIHCQSDTDEAIVRLCKSKGVGFSILKSGQYPKKPFSGIPHAFVFDHTGKEIFEGRPGEAEAAVEKALAAAPPLYLGEARFEKLKALAAQVEKKAGLAQAAAAARKKLESADAAEKGEAEALLKVLEGYARRRRQGAQALRDENPDEYLAALKAAAKEFAGDPLGDEAKAAAEKDEADPAFQQLRRAVKEVAVQEKALEGLAPCKACKQKGAKSAASGCAECKKANEAVVAKVRKALEGLAKKHEGTPAGKKAEGLAKGL